jgi:hypothetical protein
MPQRWKWLALGLVLSMTTIPFPAIGQTAKQGDPRLNPGGYEEFHSPMVLEAVFAAADRSTWRNEWFSTEQYRRLSKFRCEKISIWGLEMSARELPGEKVEVKTRVRLMNPDQNHDKKVTLLFEVVNGDKVEESFSHVYEKVSPARAEFEKRSGALSQPRNALGQVEPIKVKEGAIVTKIVTATLPLSALKTDPMTKLRITMTTWDY